MTSGRRRFLRLTGGTLAGLSLLGSGTTATAATDCADGPFELPVVGPKTVNGRSLRASGGSGGGGGGGGSAPELPSEDEEKVPWEGEEEEVDTDALGGDDTIATSSTLQRGSNLLGSGGGGGGGNLAQQTEFEGAFEPLGFVPSDSQVAPGRDYVAHAINVSLALFDKETGNKVMQVPFGGEFNADPGVFDPILRDDADAFNVPFDPRIRYDPVEGRFILMTAYDPSVSGSTKGAYLIAVSATSDPLGDWYIYRLPAYKDGFLDYPTLGFDRDAIYLSQNFFVSPFEVTLEILPKREMYAGQPVTAQSYQDLFNPERDDPFGIGAAYTVQPTAQPYTNSRSGHYMLSSDFVADSQLTLWEVEGPPGDPSLSCSTVDVPPYFTGPAAEQPNTSITIDTIDLRLMNADYDRRTGTLWTAHSVLSTWPDSDDNTPVTAVRWYEVDPGSSSVVQTGTLGEPGKWYFIPTINSFLGQTVMTYSVSGPDTFARMDLAGRSPATPPNRFGDAITVQEGEEAYQYLGGTERWGDYNGVVADYNNRTFWAVSQYATDANYPGTLTDRYGTRITEVAVRFGGGRGRGVGGGGGSGGTSSSGGTSPDGDYAERGERRGGSAGSSDGGSSGSGGFGGSGGSDGRGGR